MKAAAAAGDNGGCDKWTPLPNITSIVSGSELSSLADDDWRDDRSDVSDSAQSQSSFGTSTERGRAADDSEAEDEPALQTRVLQDRHGNTTTFIGAKYPKLCVASVEAPLPLAHAQTSRRNASGLAPRS